MNLTVCLFGEMSLGKMSIPLNSEICISVTWYTATWNSGKTQFSRFSKKKEEERFLCQGRCLEQLPFNLFCRHFLVPISIEQESDR
jgi:hypothetical protein